MRIFQCNPYYDRPSLISDKIMAWRTDYEQQIQARCAAVEQRFEEKCHKAENALEALAQMLQTKSERYDVQTILSGQRRLDDPLRRPEYEHLRRTFQLFLTHCYGYQCMARGLMHGMHTSTATHRVLDPASFVEEDAERQESIFPQ